MVELFQQANAKDGGKQTPSRRCMLILLDRFEDLHTMVYHSWTYLSLIQDIFGIKNNSFNYIEDDKAPVKTFDIDFVADSLLKENAFRGFHEVGECVNSELNSW